MRNKMKILSLTLCSFIFFSSYALGLSIAPPETASQIESEKLVNSFYIYSENEVISMLLPHHPLNETHYLSSDEETIVITLSYQDDTVYIASMDKNFENAGDCDCGDEDDSADDLIISGYQAKYTRATLDGCSAEEFLYGWAGKVFADQLINKGTTLESHMFTIQSIDHVIHLVACGPNDQSLEAKALKYAQSLEIYSYESF